MDAELIFWMACFVGGYSVVVGLLLRIALRRHPGGEGTGRD